ncbi:MAG: YceI family protein [Nannocystaceae bacterium]|nr:YceI family protein [Nannocystaceae bacterium]
MVRSNSIALALALSLSTAACSNPADGKPQAKVEEAAPLDKAATPAAKSAVYVADASSTLGFVGSKVTGSHEGGFKTFSATVDPKGGKVEGGSVSVEIEVESMFSDSEKLTGHLKSADFFDAAAHPKATFQSSEIKAGGTEGHSHTVVGNLGLHGVTKKITFPATIAMDSGKVTVKSEFSINRKDFEMGYAGMPDDLIREEVVIKLDLTFGEKA